MAVHLDSDSDPEDHRVRRTETTKTTVDTKGNERRSELEDMAMLPDFDSEPEDHCVARKETTWTTVDTEGTQRRSELQEVVVEKEPGTTETVDKGTQHRRSPLRRRRPVDVQSTPVSVSYTKTCSAARLRRRRRPSPFPFFSDRRHTQA